MDDAVEYDWYPAALAQVAPALDLRARYAAGCRGSGDRPVLRRVERALGGRRGDGRVVDIGAGTGGPAAWLSRNGLRTTLAVEPSATSLRAACVLFPDLPAVRGTAARLPLPAGGQDGALLLGVLSVVGEPDDVLREARRVVRTGGVLALTDYVALDAGALARAVLPGSTSVRLVGDLLGRVRAAGWDLREVAVGTADPDAAWVAARRGVDRRVAAHVERTPHGVQAACPRAFAAERRAREQFGRAIARGQVARTTVVARAVP